MRRDLIVEEDLAYAGDLSPLLFIGGHSDGKRILVDRNRDHVQMPFRVPRGNKRRRDGPFEDYQWEAEIYLRRFIEVGNFPLCVFVHESLSEFEWFKALIDNYRQKE